MTCRRGPTALVGGATIHKDGATGRYSANQVAKTEKLTAFTTPSSTWVREINPEISVNSLRVDPYSAVLLGNCSQRRILGCTRSGAKTSPCRTNCSAVFADFPSHTTKLT